MNSENTNKYIKFLLDNIQCSYCNEYQYVSKDNENSNNNDEFIEYKNWDLYLKEFDEYSALILYNHQFKKDIIELFKKYNFKKINELILLNTNNNTRFITLEFVSKNDDDNTSIWVPSENDYSLYERIIESDKKFDKRMNAFYIGTYNIHRI